MWTKVFEVKLDFHNWISKDLTHTSESEHPYLFVAL